MFLTYRGMSTDLVSPRSYPQTPLKMSSFGCEYNNLKRWIESPPPPPIKTKVNEYIQGKSGNRNSYAR